MEGIHTLKSLLKKDDWLVKIDLKDKSKSQEVPLLPIQQEVLPIQLSPLRPGLSPMGLYQDPEANSSSWMRAGDTVGGIHR